MSRALGGMPRAGGDSAASWPEADALFRSDPRWLGGDDAYSVELGPERILWLFGDSFIGTGNASRSDATFVHNSIGIQSGADPSRASMRFHWGARDGRAEAFFPAPKDCWYWPLHGIVVGGRLLLFMMMVRSPEGGTGKIDEWRRLGSLGFFEVFGWAALVVSNPGTDPSRWDVRVLAQRTGSVALGASIVVEDGRLYAFGWDSERKISLARWSVEEAPECIENEPEWWTDGGWARGAEPAVVIEDGATEFSVHRDPRSRGWLQAQMVSPGHLAVRRAPALDKPWGKSEVIFVPDESARPEVFVYAGKAHPHLRGADVVLTYASIADADQTLADDSIYYPRFVRMTMER